MARPPKARSLYRQVRITATQSIDGSFAYSIYAKGLESSWDQHHLLVRDRVAAPPHPLATTEDVVHALILILREQLLPGSVD